MTERAVSGTAALCLGQEHALFQASARGEFIDHNSQVAVELGQHVLVDPRLSGLEVLP